MRRGHFHGRQEALKAELRWRPAGHLSGIVSEGPEKALLVAFVATSLLFAGRKYTQAIKDDIGDKSVFQYVPAPVHWQKQSLTISTKAPAAVDVNLQ